jgi:hypothetical protein
MTTSTPKNLPATEGPAMGPASPHSAAANELREEANDGRLIAAAAVCLPAPDRFRTWENEVPSLVCNASAPASGRWKLLLAPLFVGGEPATTRARAAGSKWCMPRRSTATASPRSQPCPALTSCPCSHRRAARPGEEALRSPRRHARPRRRRDRAPLAHLPARRRESRARGTDAAVGSGGRRRRPGGGRPG